MSKINESAAFGGRGGNGVVNEVILQGQTIIVGCPVINFSKINVAKTKVTVQLFKFLHDPSL